METPPPSCNQDNKDVPQALNEEAPIRKVEQLVGDSNQLPNNIPWWKWAIAALVVGVCGGALYSHPKMLVGGLVYDDGSTVAKNPVVLGLTHWKELFLRDFWGGDRLTDPKSHKSFRPVTTVTLRLNYIHAVHYWKRTMDDVETYGFHVTNMLFHVTVSMLSLPASYYAFGGSSADCLFPSFLSALLFALHPVHSEAVQNITGRAEPLMAIFFLLGFIVYASAHLKVSAQSVWPSSKQLLSTLGTLVCLILALLSKEMGITLTMLCAYWDFFVAAKLSLTDLFLVFPFNDVEGSQRRQRLKGWLVRTTLLGVPTILIAYLRLKLNGGNPPFLRYNANRHAIEPIFDGVPPELVVGGDTGVHGVYRWLSIAWLWVRYMQICVVPLQLSPDWSGPSISLVRSFGDRRVWVMMCVFPALICVVLLAGCRRVTKPAIMNAIGFFVFPFLLASNVFVVAGTTLAERVVYLPSLGFCMAYGLILTTPWVRTGNTGGDKGSRIGPFEKLLKTALFVALGAGFSYKCVEHNFAWTSSETLWAKAFEVNPTSSHAIQNFAIHALGSNDMEQVRVAAEALNSIRSFEEVDRVDADEMYSPLVLCTRRMGDWRKALELGAEAWERTNQREEAYNRGVKYWHMHELKMNVEKFPLRRARILAGQATTLAHLDIKESAVAITKAVELASHDSVVMQMARDLENYASNNYFRFEGGVKPYQTEVYERYMSQFTKTS